MIAISPADSARAVDPLWDCTGTWWVAVTRPRYEARLVRDLAAPVDRRWPAQYEVGRAIVVKEKVVRREYDAKGRPHNRTSERPLFPGYVFINGDHDYRETAAKSLATIQIIAVNNQRRLHDELSEIVRAVEAYPTLGTARIAEGQRVRVTAGPMVAFEGEVILVRPGVVSLSLTMMGTAVMVEVPREFIEPV